MSQPPLSSFALSPEDAQPMCAEPITESALSKILGFQTHHFEKFKTAFVHADVAEAVGSASYDRYEFLGDSVINLLCAKFLYDKFGGADEGFLTKSRSKLVCTKSLAVLSTRLGLPRHAVMTKRAFDTAFNQNPRVAEDIFESLVGCLYETHGLMEAKRFFLSRLADAYGSDDFAILYNDDNFKDGLMRWCQAHGLPLPTYHTFPPLPESSVDSTRSFGVCIMVGDRQSGFGRAPTKKAAEQFAARSALATLGVLDARGFVDNSRIRRRE